MQQCRMVQKAICLLIYQVSQTLKPKQATWLSLLIPYFCLRASKLVIYDVCGQKGKMGQNQIERDIRKRKKSVHPDNGESGLSGLLGEPQAGPVHVNFTIMSARQGEKDGRVMVRGQALVLSSSSLY